MDELGDRDRDLREGPSKSQRKRDMHELQGLAERLAHRPRRELERLKLGPDTRAALDETARIKDPRALPRHFKHIARLLIREELDAVNALLHESEAVARREAARLHRVERWRERLIAEGDAAVSGFLDLCSGADRPRLRALVRAARRDRERGKPDSARKLFRLLRDELDREGGMEG